MPTLSTTLREARNFPKIRGWTTIQKGRKEYCPYCKEPISFPTNTVHPEAILAVKEYQTGGTYLYGFIVWNCHKCKREMHHITFRTPVIFRSTNNIDEPILLAYGGSEVARVYYDELMHSETIEGIEVDDNRPMPQVVDTPRLVPSVGTFDVDTEPTWVRVDTARFATTESPRLVTYDEYITGSISTNTTIDTRETAQPNLERHRMMAGSGSHTFNITYEEQ